MGVLGEPIDRVVKESVPGVAVNVSHVQRSSYQLVGRVGLEMQGVDVRWARQRENRGAPYQRRHLRGMRRLIRRLLPLTKGDLIRIDGFAPLSPRSDSRTRVPSTPYPYNVVP